MNQATNAPRVRSALPLGERRIVLAYSICASLWIVFSDRILERWQGFPPHPFSLQSFKGLNFVLTTAILLYVVLRKSYDRWRRSERVLQEIQERFAWAGRAAADSIWEWDIRTDTVWRSEGFYRLFGYDDASSRPELGFWVEHVHPEDRPRVQAGLKHAVAAGQQRWSAEYRFRRKDGLYAYVQDRGFLVRDEQGQPQKMVGGMSDMTERRRAEVKLENSHRQLRALSARLHSLRDEEHTRISREIHDSFGQLLTGIKLNLAWVEDHIHPSQTPEMSPVLDKIVEAGELTDAAIKDVRRIAGQLRPALLDHLGIQAALRNETLRFTERTRIPCEFEAAPGVGETLPKASAASLYRIVQEALTNVARHAAATRVRVTMERCDVMLNIQVEDNGKGMDLGKLEDPSALGLLGMQERAAQAGGHVGFARGSSGGTVVKVTLPAGPVATTIAPAAQ